jgi:serine-type D-Ala-D-Ala carboxypeptidase (penicillin-binding protein 5/6)
LSAARAVLGAAACAAALVPCAAARAAPPAIGAPEAILVEPQTQDVVYARRASMRRPIASTTKLMTALLTLERARLTDVFTAAPYSPSPAESLMGLHAGERLTVADLLRGLLVVSANDAAVTLAVDVAGSQRRFVGLMNRRARQLGLRDTHYANPVGLDEPGNYSSAADLVKLTLVLRQRAFFRATTNLGSVTLRSGSRVRHLVNRNDLVRTVPYVNGVKTGHTNNAGYILVGSATRGGVTLVSAVLGDSSEGARDADTMRLLSPGRAGAQGQRVRQRRPQVPRRERRPGRRAHRHARRAPRRAAVDPRARRTRRDRGPDGRRDAGRDHPRAPARPRRRSHRAGRGARRGGADAQRASGGLPRPRVDAGRPRGARPL